MLTAVFVLVRIVPGDPTIAILGDQASEAARAELRERLGLAKPIRAQYSTSSSDRARRSRALAVDQPADRRGSARRAALYDRADPRRAGLRRRRRRAARRLAAERRGGFVDLLRAYFSLVGVSFPAFVSGILLLICSRSSCAGFRSSRRQSRRSARRLDAITLPAISLGLRGRLCHARDALGMLKVLDEDYVRTARARACRNRSSSGATRSATR